MSNFSFRKIVELSAYIAIILIMVSMTVGVIFPSIAHICNIISSVIALVITGIVAFLFARSKRNILFMILYIIVVVVIIVLYFI